MNEDHDMNASATNQGDDRLLAELVQAAEPRIDPNTIAAAVGGQQHRPEVAALSRDPEAVLLMRHIARERARRGRRLWGRVALAACLALGIVLWVQSGEAPRERASVSERLASAVEALRRDHPAELGDLALVSDEVGAGPSGRLRGGAQWVGPSGRVLRETVALRWRNPEGAGRVAVTLDGPGVSWREEVEGESVESPSLQPGRYVVTLRALDGLAGQTTRRSFSVASEEERARYAAARRAWQGSAPQDLHDLIEAHYAFAHGYLEAARAAALRAVRDDAGVRALVQPFLGRTER